jgi:hypothetical protein
MSGTPYSQTLLLDCNRKSSVEFSASNLAETNTALWTNQVSSGITLDIGDQISVQSAHIAQRGAGGDIIEFAGKVLGQKNISYTESISSSYIGLGIYQISSPDVAFRDIQITPEGFAYEASETKTEQIQERDNEASIVISYHKNTNGENYITLPRNHGSASGIYSPDYLAANTSEKQWNVSDGYDVGCNTFNQNASHVFEDDYKITTGIRARPSGTDVRSCVIRKLKNDNKRFTLFKQKRIVWNMGYVSSASAKEYLHNEKVLTDASVPDSAKCDPALHDYVWYKEKKVVEIPQGYNSPANVAAEITNYLTTTDEPEFISDTIYGTQENSVIVNSTLNRAFPCTNWVLFDRRTAQDYFNSNTSFIGAPGPPSLDTAFSGGGKAQLATQYLNSYAYVGFKRPEIIEAGRDAFPYNGFKTLGSMSVSNASSQKVETNIPWTEENLLKIKTLFDAQSLYPDLIRGGLTQGRTNYTTTFNATSGSLGASFAEEARFLHIDLNKADVEFDPLGDDMYNVSYVSGTIAPPPTSDVVDRSSTPIFVAFNKNSSYLTSNESDGQSYENLVYGFAQKNTLTLGVDNPLITFLTKEIGGIPSSYYSSSTIAQETKIGYDYHFNGYGNAAIILSSGFAPVQYYGYQGFASARLCRNVYVGSNNPAFAWNPQSSRFEFENLHTAEKVGNFYNAGDPAPAATVFGPPGSAEAGNDCYKIDKQLHYTTWSPSMFPYSELTVTGSGTDQKTFPKMNPNLDFDLVYDSHCGVAIEDMGYSQRSWDQGLWGIIGYNYNQFNPSGPNIQNRLMEYQDDTINVNGVTTNADISSVDSQSYITNVWSINLYSQQLNSQINYFASPKNFSNYFDSATHVVAPSSVILANSTKITSAKLPRRILRGYFLINSDILDQANFYQTANPLQTMAMVGKYNGANGFIQYDGGGAVFTCTRKKTITSVKSQILDPEGGLAQIGDNSGIIYRIDKQITTDLNFGKNLLAGMYGKPPQ